MIAGTIAVSGGSCLEVRIDIARASVPCVMTNRWWSVASPNRAARYSISPIHVPSRAVGLILRVRDAAPVVHHGALGVAQQPAGASAGALCPSGRDQCEAVCAGTVAHLVTVVRVEIEHLLAHHGGAGGLGRLQSHTIDATLFQ